ncbi:MAG: 16S rRNA (adenine(1518)-N(6)/adenine(1519)-N(6))-dimethyltransferase RsmA [Gemmatimonadota bacterium]
MTRSTRPRLGRARKSLGQHFLVSDRAATRIAEALGDVAGRTVVEIGPGRGILTAALLRRGARVVGLELDEALVDYLRARFADQALEVLHQDALELDLTALACERRLEPPLHVAGNIPYGITSPLLRRLLARPGELARAALMLQREVAERLLAEPGTPAYGSLTVGVRAAAEVTHVLTLSPARFRPPPKVWSSVVRIDPRPDAPEADRLAALEELTKTLFSARRKQLQKTLRQAGIASEAELPALERALGEPLTNRPEELPVEKFLVLLDLLRRETGARGEFSTRAKDRVTS